MKSVRLELFDRARALVALEPSRLDVVTVANPGRHAMLEGMLVVNESTLWVVDHHAAQRLDALLLAAFRVDPDDDILGRLRVAIEAA